MSVYESRTVRQLRALLQERGLDSRGRRNVLVSRLLEDDDNNNAVDNFDVFNDDENDTDEVVIRSDQSDARETGAASSSQSIRALELQMRIEELKLEQCRLGLGQSPSADHFIKPSWDGLKFKLPVMSEHDDILVFFAAFERCLTLHDIPREGWAKLVSPHLNGRAQAVYATIPMADCGSYDSVKARLCGLCYHPNSGLWKL